MAVENTKYFFYFWLISKFDLLFFVHAANIEGSFSGSVSLTKGETILIFTFGAIQNGFYLEGTKMAHNVSSFFSLSFFVNREAITLVMTVDPVFEHFP